MIVYMNNNIIKGYKGIMDLDLSGVPKEYHYDVINQHYKDIKEYKVYQSGLKKNIVMKILFNAFK